MPGGLAARVMGWQRRMGATAGPLSASGEQSNGDPLWVELLIAGVWTDITAYVLTRDGGERIRITRGRRDQGGRAEQSTCEFQLNNRDGRFSPRNPTSPYYGVLGRNQQFRVSVPGPTGEKCYRFWGEVSKWPTKWDRTGRDVWVECEATGLLQRLAQGGVPKRSVIYGAITNPQLSSLVAYWPCEDVAGSDRIASALTNGSPMLITGVSPEYAAVDRFGASDPLPTFTGAAAVGGVAKYDTTSVTSVQIRFLLYVPPEGGLSDLEEIVRITVDDTTYATRYWDICYNHPADTPSYGPRGTLTVDAKDGDESPLGLGGTVFGTMDTRGKLLRVSLELSNNGSNLAGTLRTLNLVTGEQDSAAFTEASTNVARILDVQIGPDTLLSSPGAAGVAVGHVTVQTTITDLTDLGEAVDPSGETAGRRIQRICGEKGIPFDWIGDLDATVAMGGQARQKPVDVMRAAEEADGGMLFESLQVFGLGYRTRESLNNQAPAITLSYSASELSEVPEPVEDDQPRNLITVTNSTTGNSEVAELTTGSMSTAEPPVGIGEYGDPVDLNLLDDSTLADQANWRLHVATAEEARYPQITINLARDQIVGNPALRAQALSVRSGDLLVLTDPPAHLPPDDISQLVQGMSESIDWFQHVITFIGEPAAPWATGILEDEVYSRIDTDGSALYADAAEDATTLYVTQTEADSLWTTDDTDFPFDIRAGGEVVTVTDITHRYSDDFTRTESSGWGTSSGGDAWTCLGTATDFSVNGTQGVVTLAASPSSVRAMMFDDSIEDCEILATLSVDQVATGASFVPAILTRFINASEFYRGRVHFGTSGTMFTSVTRGTTQIGSTVTLPYTYSAGDTFYLRVSTVGKRVMVKAWPTTEVEPKDWHSNEIIDTGAIASGQVGLTASAFPGNTNVNPELRYDDYQVLDPQKFTVTRSVNGVEKAQTAGTDVRLAHPTILSL